MGTRTTWFKEKLQNVTKTVTTVDEYSGEVHAVEQQIKEDYKPAKPSEANLISSLCTNGMHMPVLDIDVPVYKIPSSTEGHCHLYIEKEMQWNQYVNLLQALLYAGIIEKGYYDASVNKGATFVRVPWVKKEEGDANV